MSNYDSFKGFFNYSEKEELKMCINIQAPPLWKKSLTNESSMNILRIKSLNGDNEF